MRLEQYLSEYADDHRHPVNQIIHKICVPAIALSFLGILYMIPFPFVASFGMERLYMNWAAVFAFFAMCFYLLLIPRSVFYLCVFTLCALGFFVWWESQYKNSVLPTCLIVFIAAWIGQLIGHRIEGRKPSFFKNLQFLLIGPLWVFAPLLSRANSHARKHDDE